MARNKRSSTPIYAIAGVVAIVVIVVIVVIVSQGGGSKAAGCTPAGKLPESGQRGEQFSSPPAMIINTSCQYVAKINTSKGDITIRLEPKAAPLAVNNFVFLATHKFYTHILFHRVIKGFMIQSGDPQGTGAGGPGYSFKVENSGSNFTAGTLAMANTGQPDSNGSQFFICDEGSGCGQSLDGAWAQGQGYTIFGQVTSGMAVVHALATVPVTANSQGEDSSPVTPIYMNSVEIYRSA